MVEIFAAVKFFFHEPLVLWFALIGFFKRDKQHILTIVFSYGEFLYAAALLNENVRNELIRMLSWQVGFETDFSLSVGKKAKFLERYVVPYVWGRLCQTFAMATYDQVWDALFTATQLFTEASHTVAGHLGCAYPSYEAAILPLLQQRHQECQDHE